MANFNRNTNIKRWSTYVALAALGATTHADIAPIIRDDPSVRELVPFETSLTGQGIRLTPRNLTATVETQGGTMGSAALRIQAPASSTATFNELWITPATPWNFQGTGGFMVDLRSQSAQRMAIGVRLEDANGVFFERETVLHPYDETRLAVTFDFPGNPMAMGMRSLPTLFDRCRTMNGIARGTFDQTRVRRIWVYTRNNGADRDFIVDKVSVLQPTRWSNSLWTPWIDSFGQNRMDNWEGKVATQSTLASRAAMERVRRLNTGPAGRDRFGGSTTRFTSTASGAWRTEQRDGRWWMITPDGNPYFGLGVGAVNPSEGRTMITGRTGMFSDLPARTSSLGDHYEDNVQAWAGPVRSGTTFNHYTANLERKYGDNWLAEWRNEFFSRMNDWGFNMVGNWSEEGLYAAARMPYTTRLGTSGSFRRLDTGRILWEALPDPYDTAFRSAIANHFSWGSRTNRNDPFCIGYFVDNEQSWNGPENQAGGGNFGVAIAALARDASTQPAKAGMISFLTSRYGSISTLNNRWGTRFSSWAAMRAPITVPSTASAAWLADLDAMTLDYARTYFRTVREELKRAAPNKLYLGSRFARFPRVVARAAAEYCDVVSFNVYQDQLDNSQWGWLTTLNKPVLISEFSFAADDRGLSNDLFAFVGNQTNRARGYQNFVNSARANPAVVGATWFQYFDQPVAGRVWDGENHNWGLVDICDQPHTTLVNTIRSVNRSIYQ